MSTATDFIRAILDLVDAVDARDGGVEKNANDASIEQLDPAIQSRFKQIFAMLSTDDSNKEYVNSPDEVITDIDSVTVDAGGGLNSPSHTADIRVKDPSQYN